MSERQKRDLMKAGSSARLRMTAATNGWRVERRYLEDGRFPQVQWRHQDGAVYITGDPEQLPWPLAERVRVLLCARFDGCCPACGSTGGYVEGTPTEDLDRLQFTPIAVVAGGVAVRGELALAIEHDADCPGRPGAIARDVEGRAN